ncbi:hypothetical protein BD408DRAFT_414201 [Parasitella parasitica]|nr:hypothetical protein BD408DRAFT_414201 [Parasitella parasitica]
MEDLVEEVHMKDVAKGTYNNYSDKQKAVFYYFHKIKLLKAAPSARKAGINIRTAQLWAKNLEKTRPGTFTRNRQIK